MNARRTSGDISVSSELGFANGDHGWKTMDEQSVVETLNEGFDNLKRTEF
jgi:hypothetical protein